MTDDEADTLGAEVLAVREGEADVRAVRVADCVVAEVARFVGSSVATSDPHLLDLSRDEGINLPPLPDSQGDRWSP